MQGDVDSLPSTVYILKTEGNMADWDCHHLSTGLCLPLSKWRATDFQVRVVLTHPLYEGHVIKLG